jgi:hypothetical protein
MNLSKREFLQVLAEAPSSCACVPPIPESLQ